MVYLDRFAILIFENRGLDFERTKIQPPIFASGPSVSGPGILGGYDQSNETVGTIERAQTSSKEAIARKNN